MTLAFLCVIINTVLLTPVLLYGFNLAHDGWAWQHAVLFSAMVASTDAVSVTAVLHSGQSPLYPTPPF
jgi:NhaP-type Na+/H+ or K+/H+ antiporter